MTVTDTPKKEEDGSNSAAVTPGASQNTEALTNKDIKKDKKPAAKEKETKNENLTAENKKGGRATVEEENSGEKSSEKISSNDNKQLKKAATTKAAPPNSVGTTSGIFSDIVTTPRDAVRREVIGPTDGPPEAFKINHREWQAGQFMMYMAHDDAHPRVLMMMGTERGVIVCLELTKTWMRFVSMHHETLLSFVTTKVPRERDMQRFTNVFANPGKGRDVSVPKFFSITNKEAGALLEDERPVIKIYRDEEGEYHDQFEDDAVDWMHMASVRGSEASNSVLAVSLQPCVLLPNDGFKATITQTWSEGDLARMIDLIKESKIEFPMGPSEFREASIDNIGKISDGRTTDPTRNNPDITITHCYKAVDEVGRYSNQTQQYRNETNHKHQRGANCRDIVPFNERRVGFAPDEPYQNDEAIYNSDRPEGPRCNRTRNDQPKRQLFGSRANQPNNYQHAYSGHQQHGLTSNQAGSNYEMILYPNNNYNNPFDIDNTQVGIQGTTKMDRFWHKIVNDTESGTLTHDAALVASGLGNYYRRTETASELRIEGNKASKNKQKSNRMFWMIIGLAGEAKLN